MGAPRAAERKDATLPPRSETREGRRWTFLKWAERDSNIKKDRKIGVTGKEGRSGIRLLEPRRVEKAGYQAVVPRKEKDLDALREEGRKQTVEKKQETSLAEGKKRR